MLEFIKLNMFCYQWRISWVEDEWTNSVSKKNPNTKITQSDNYSKHPIGSHVTTKLHKWNKGGSLEEIGENMTNRCPPVVTVERYVNPPAPCTCNMIGAWKYGEGKVTENSSIRNELSMLYTYGFTIILVDLKGCERRIFVCFLFVCFSFY